MVDLAFQQGCLQLGLEKKLDFFVQYVQLIMKWNDKLNLVGRQQDVARLYHHHVLDSLLVWPYLKNIQQVCDVGSGAGFPALCWALAKEDLQLTLVEKSPKKVQFLTQAVKELNLGNRVSILNQRVEHVQLKAELMSSRALTSTADFLRMTEHLATPSSTWWLLKAKNEKINEEIALVNQQQWNIKIIPLEHPTQAIIRNLVEVTRNNNG